MDYNSLNNLNDSDRSSLASVFQGILTGLKHISVSKAVSYLRYIQLQGRKAFLGKRVVSCNSFSISAYTVTVIWLTDQALAYSFF